MRAAVAALLLRLRLAGGDSRGARPAKKLSVPTVGVRTDGFSVGEWLEAGALDVFDSLMAFRHALDGTALAHASR